MARFLTYGCRQNYARKRQVPPPSDTTGWHKRLAHYGEEGHLAKTSKQGIISSAPAAQRIAEVSRLFPMVLVREDPRVQATLLAWLERMADEAPTDRDETLRILMGDATNCLRCSEISVSSSIVGSQGREREASRPWPAATVSSVGVWSNGGSHHDRTFVRTRRTLVRTDKLPP